MQDFARHVLETSVGCRLEMLKEFYTHKHSHDAVVDVVSNLYSQAPNAGRKGKYSRTQPSFLSYLNTCPSSPNCTLLSYMCFSSDKF